MSEHVADQQPSTGLAESAGAIATASTGIASALLTVVAGACCVSPVLAPILVGMLGASGAVWAAGLKPYGWWILGASAVFLALGFWSVYRPRPVCSITDAHRPKRVMDRVAKVSLWVGAVFWVAGAMVRAILP
jgi:hypothetical protein